MELVNFGNILEYKKGKIQSQAILAEENLLRSVLFKRVDL